MIVCAKRSGEKDRSRQNWSSVNKSSISPNNEPANRNKTGLICGHVLHLEEYTSEGLIILDHCCEAYLRATVE
jgi:hypothetical protein